MPLTRKSVEDCAGMYFRQDEINGILELLEGYKGYEPERVRICILMLSEGRVEKIKHYLDTAQKDYRDILYWADPHNRLSPS